MTIARLVAAMALAGGVARADGWKVQLEAGAGGDTNVHRESGGSPTGALDAAAGGRFSASGRVAEAVRLAASALALGRGYAGADASGENVFVLAADARADFLLGDAVPGVRASYYDAFAAQSDLTSLDFRAGEAAGALALRDGDHRVEAFAGWRFYRFKPNAAFDFDGERAGVRYAFAPAGDGDAWALRAGYGINRRAYSAPAIANLCPSGAPVAPSCLVPTGRDRVDLFHDAAVEVTWTGAILASARYQLMVNDSSSFAQSLLRHRVELAATLDTWLELVVTVKLLLQWSRYPDGLLLGGDLGTFTTIEDETRNALIVHVTREIADGWMAEARYAYYASPFAPGVASYTRHVLYVGAVVTFGGP
ncbi:MAG TPA: hypothetical protein VKE22_03055 [Haliangiales bacterium]|nr:hypothetical protein [Haliangiales bacterium]